MHPSYRPLPSPATPGTSLTHYPHPSYGFPSVPLSSASSSIITMNRNLSYNDHRHASTGSIHSISHSQTNHPDYSDSESEGEGGTKLEKDKLEIRREKNRVKQRNLRLRRANHIADLEKNLTTLKTEHSSLQTSIGHLQQHQVNLQGWIHDLETALFANGLAGEVETIRRIWTERNDLLDRGVSAAKSSHGVTFGSGPSSGHVHSQPQPETQSQPQRPQPHPQVQVQLPTPTGQDQQSRDPLTTLARAASSVPAPPGLGSSSAYNEGRMIHPPTSVSDGRPTLPRPSSFSMPGSGSGSASGSGSGSSVPTSSRSFENPYPTPEIGWGSQMSEWMQPPDSIEKKRKRERDSHHSSSDYHRPLSSSSSASMRPGSSSNRPGLHPMSGRLSESNIHTLAPIQSYRQTSPISNNSRPLSAPYQSHTPTSRTAQSSISAQGGVGSSTTGNVSPRSIRISDLVSPRPSQVELVLPSLSTSISGSDFARGSLSELKRDVERRSSREGGWSRSNSISGFAPISEISHGNGTILPPLRYYQQDEDMSITRRPSEDQDYFNKKQREISPKTRVSLSPTAIGSRSPLLKVKEQSLLDGKLPKSA
ncbi:uncharacterized protein IL334_001410 [Kwoniella shivajii]|uniref:BZIP domain-containing protein n=1 Tax=Kwoniella shivajii TaxID=564305 RepID=A0ABZ1CRT4_9TREE|nr:hypothetical protein IL334_001410 [Kwoniella shivajii]